jgi:hypothetical protein
MEHNLQNVPANLVKSILLKTDYIVEQSKKITEDFESFKTQNRNILQENGFLHKVKESNSKYNGIISGIDGSMIVNPKSFGDFIFASSVEAPFGNINYYDNIEIPQMNEVEIIPRDVENKIVTGALMSLLEVHLAGQTKSDICMIDGSFFSTIVNIVKGVQSLNKLPGGIEKNSLSKRVKEYLGQDFNFSLNKILGENKYVAFPKYSTQTDQNNSFGLILDKNQIFDFKTILSRSMEAGEYTSYVKNSPINDSQKEKMDSILEFSHFRDDIFSCLDNIYSFYYKPNPWGDAIRIDTVGILQDSDLDNLLEAVRFSCRYAAIKEPYPLFLADDWAKNISQAASPLIDGAVINQIEDPELKYMFTFSYRTS